MSAYIYLSKKYVRSANRFFPINHEMQIDMPDDASTSYFLKYVEVKQKPLSDTRAFYSEQIYFGTSFARMYLVANILGINCAAGMSSLIRRDILESAGGLRAFSSYLAEDFFIAKEVLKSGHHIDISSQPALQNSGIGGVGVFQDRITRYVFGVDIISPDTKGRRHSHIKGQLLLKSTL